MLYAIDVFKNLNHPLFRREVELKGEKSDRRRATVPSVSTAPPHLYHNAHTNVSKART
jgi:hypothetical protein